MLLPVCLGTSVAHFYDFPVFDRKVPYTDPKQIKADFKRDHYSDGDDFNTIRIPNELIDEYSEKIADAIAEVVRKRQV